MNNNVWAYIFIMAGVSYLLRVLPMTLIRKEITNPFIKNVLYYIPYVTIRVMTFPSILYVSDNIMCGVAAFVVAGLVAWFTRNLVASAVVACISVFIVSIL